MTRTLQGDAGDEYLLNTGPDVGREQLHYLAELLDGQTTAALDATGVEQGLRCLDLGAGAGSIAAWLAERTSPTGHVVAVDIDTTYLGARSGVEICAHDINRGIPPGGPFDLIHSRLLLMHLSRRAEILRLLVDALAPGGWLVIGEYVGGQERVLTAPGPTDAELFRRMQHLMQNVIGRGGGISYEWAREVDDHMAEAGLVDIASVEYTHTSAGGSVGCLLNDNYARQCEPLLLTNGVTREELGRYSELMRDPRFRAWLYPFVCTRGRKPVS